MADEIVIRLLVESDQNAFADLVNDYIKEYTATEKVYPVHFDPAIGQTYWDEVTNTKNDYVILVAETNEQLIGFCIGQIHHFGAIEKVYFEGDRRGEVWDFFVIPPYRSQGIGEKMLKQMEKEFLTHDCQNMVLNGVDIKNDKAKKLYERLGYKEWKAEYYKDL